MLFVGLAAANPDPTERVSVSSAGDQANGFSREPAVDADGRTVVFESGADDLVADDGNGLLDVFLRDRDAGTTVRVSISNLGGDADGHSAAPDISDSGARVVFDSTATDLILEDTNSAGDVFLREYEGTPLTVRVSVGDNEEEGDLSSDTATISGNGQVVAFYSIATNLVAGDDNGATDLFVRDLDAGTTERINPDTASFGSYTRASLSTDGRFVAFAAGESLVAEDTNGFSDIYLYDRELDSLKVVSVGEAEESDGSSWAPDLSSDARYVAFESEATNLAPGDGTAGSDVFVYDRVTETTTRISDPEVGGSAPTVSGDGRLVSFQTPPVDLGFFEIAVLNRADGNLERVTVDSSGGDPDGQSHAGEVSYDGGTVVFSSDATDLVAGDTNDATDVFVRNLAETNPLTPGTFTVTSTDDTTVGGCTVSHCTLREAIAAANGAAGQDTIDFDIFDPSGAVQTITLTSALPTITDPVTIDGYTQPGASANTLAVGNDANLLIELNGNDASLDGLAVTAGATTITGLVINNFRGDAIDLRTNGNNLIVGNFLGTNPNGTGLPANGGGIFIQNSPDNRIGGDAPAARNVINATQNYAIYTPGACVGCPVDTGGGNIIQGNYLGTDKHGTGTIATPPNVRGGIRLENDNNVIGGTTAGARNVLSTVGVGGVTLQEAGAHHNTIQGNYIGVDANGTAAIAPGWGLTGITVLRADDNTIGGADPAARNVIATSTGISIFGVGGVADDNVVQNNYIGTNAAGSAALPASANAGPAVVLDNAGGNTVADNVLSNSLAGVSILPGSANNVVRGNRMGTNAAGTAALPNNRGVSITSSSANTIGGTTAADRNVISGNTTNGVFISGSNATVQGNYIGLGSDGSTLIGNQSSGVSISGNNNVIGGISPGAGNEIAGSGPFFAVDGVEVLSGTGNAIRGNSTHSNANLGIDLGGNGPTANDTGNPDDADTGANNLQNFPVLTGATQHTGFLEIDFELHSTPSTSFDVDFYSQPSCGVGDDEAEVYLGSNSYTTDGDGDVSDSASLSDVVLTPGSGVSATATDPQGNTSEVSGCQLVESDPAQAGPAFTVNTPEDHLANGCTEGDCTLREAVQAANAAAGANQIHFAISGDDQTIVPSPELPNITGAVVIDGTTQPGYSGTPLVGIDGASLAGGSAGLRVGGSGSTIKALAITNVNGNAIYLTGSGHTVESSYLGTNGAGDDLGNSIGVFVEGTGHTIGGSTAAARNIISGNDFRGVLLNGTGATGNTVRGNYVGTTPGGGAALANPVGIYMFGGASNNTVRDNVVSGGLTGVAIGPGSGNVIAGNLIGTDATGGIDLGNARGVLTTDGSTGNTIGGTTAADRNVISGNDEVGVRLAGTSTGNTVQGNYIGTDGTGNLALPNVIGVEISGGGANNNTVGGSTAAMRNVIAGNTGDGILISGSINAIQGNTIGLTADGTTALGNGGDGVKITGGNGNTIGGSTGGAGNLISANGGRGVNVGASGNSVLGNLIGTDAAGTADRGNTLDGVYVNAGPATVGGAAAGARNVISGNGRHGVFVQGGGSSGSAVQGNYIGVDVNGTADLGNTNEGIAVNLSADNDLVGNVIAGNDASGINLNGNTGNEIRGNRIGTNAAGSAAIPNNTGVVVDGANFNAANTVIGGTTEADRNLVSGNQFDGVLVIGSQTNGLAIRGNYIGTNVSGDSALGNGFDGIELFNGPTGTAIGGTVAGARNVISGNGTGIRLQGGNSNVISGNLIGKGVSGGALGNTTSGIHVVGGTPQNTIGGTTAAAANEIAHNGGDGIFLAGGTGTAIRGNAIHTNGGLGIDITPDGVTANDTTPPDGDGGPNNTQNFPVLSSAGNGSVAGTLQSAPGTQFTIELFHSSVCDGSGSGEGAQLIAARTVTTDGTGHATIDESSLPLPNGQQITATATDPNGNTSEFSTCVLSAGRQTFTVTSNDDADDGTCDPAHCSLREAINAANANPGPDDIHFDIGAGGTQTIQPTSPLPALTGPTIVDGTTQDGFEDDPLVVINGASAGALADGLVVSGGASEIRGLVINGFAQGSGIVLNTAGTNVVAGNWIGANATNTGSAPNANGITIAGESDNNTIGGTVAAGRNVIRGNTIVVVGESFVGGSGVTIQAGSTGNALRGNDIFANTGFGGVRVFGSSNTIGGTADGSGNVVHSNNGDGIALEGDNNTVQGNIVEGNGAGVFVSGATNVIGGTTAAARNVISGNEGSGVWIHGSSATGNEVLGNYIGTDAGGTLDLGNDSGNEGTAAGVFINNGAANNIIGGVAAGAGNVLSGNETAGVLISNAHTNQILGNKIGTNADGDAALPNGVGVEVSSEANGNVIGGNDPSERNLISGNEGDGIQDSAEDTVIQGNYIGTNAGGSAAIGNGENGIRVQGLRTEIGGASDEGNVISENSARGVLVAGAGSIQIRNNYVGTDATGEEDLGNGGAGIQVEGGSSNVEIGADDGRGNVISGNVSGVAVFGAATTGVTIEANLIGTDDDGDEDLGNSTVGVDVDLGAAGAQVEDNVISGNGQGIEITGASNGTTIQGNLIGTDESGAADLGNDGAGVYLESVSGTTLGGTAAGARNVISGNGHGIVITGSATSNGVQGNYIGTNAAGGAAVPNDVGIAVTGAAAPNTIGGVVAAAGNLISGNTTIGLRISASGDEAGQTVNGNVIGVGADGTTPLGNGIGILVDGSPNNEIGDPSATARNVIGFNDEGIVVTGGASSGNAIAGNFVGVSAPDGAADLGNVEVGIRIVAPAGGNLIGGPAAPDRNMVSGNGGIGIDLGGSGNSVQNNLVGTNAAGAAIGNTGVGISITGSDNTIGGNDPATANKIAFNGSDGVAVMGSAVNNRITANSIVSNGSTDNDIGIDLAGNGVSANDPNDADSGPNNHQNFPVLNAVTAEAGSPRIVGTLQSAPSTAYRIDYFETPCAGPGDREGDRWLGWSLISTNADGVATIDTGEGLTSEIAAGEFVTTTATDPDGNTSEFSACTEVTTSAPPADAAISLESSSPSVIAGAQSVPIDGISLSELTQDPGGTRQSAPMDGIPMDGIDLAASPMDGIPMDGIGLTPGLLDEVFGGVHLSDIPLSTPGGWDAVLAGTPLGGVPLNTITLADVYALTDSPISDISLGEIDLSRTPMDGIPLVGLALGPLLLSEIPLDPAPPNDAAANLADWCAEMNEEPGYACSNPDSLAGETLMAATVRGLPMDGIPMDGIPMDGIDLSGTPMDGIPMDGIDLTGTPMDGIPMDGIDFAVSPMDGIPMDGIDILGSSFAEVKIDDISPATRDQVVDCASPGFDCAGKTLGQAKQAGRIRPGANLGMLDGALGDITLGEVVDALLGSFGLTLPDLFLGLPPPERTLHDLLSILLGATAYEWSDLSLSTFPIAQHSPDGGVITYRATFTVTGGSSPTTATVHALVPEGGIYKDSSSALVATASGAAVPVGEPTLTNNQLEWRAEVEVGVEYRLTWQVHAPLRLGDYSVGANVVVPGMTAAALSSPVRVAVVETQEPNNNMPGTAPELAGDTLYLSHVPSGDVDRFVVPIPTAFGSTVKITLSHIPAGSDLDLVVAGPPAPTLRDAPANTIPLQNAQLPDAEVALDERGQALAPETLPDVPSDVITTGGNVLRGTSVNRGNADEEVALLSQGETGQYVVQVSRYEGDSALPYMLQVEVEGPPNLGACDAPRRFPFEGQGVAGTMPSNIPQNMNTLILVNQKRLGDTYGFDEAARVMNSLNQLAGRADLGIVGAVVPVESSNAVDGAYTAWDGNPCSPAAANNVVSRIGELVDSIEPENLQFKVIVGGDDQIPFGRVADETVFANEQDYAASLPGANNQYKSAFAHGLLLTDDVWAEEAAPQFLGHELFVPDQAVGRLVETPGDITGMISAFLAPAVNGAITPQRSVTTGYDFLKDGADAVNSPFATAFGANARTLINDTWPGRDASANDQPDDLEDALFPPGPALPPQLNSINAHFDHTRLLPAAENAAHRSANLYTSQDVRDRGASAVAQRILFSMGCHSGLATSDAVYGSADPLSKDWAQTFLSGGAFAWIGNTGFGLGDTVDVAYTERLHAFFTGNLDGSLSLGEALAQAKQEYLAGLGIVSGYDAKVVMQTTLYGLPMLDVGGGVPPATPDPLPLQQDPATGLQAASFNETPSFTLVSRENGKFYRAETTQVTNRRPIEPVVSLDVTQPGKVAHGVVITSLHSRPDEGNFDAAFSRVVNDKSEDEPEVVGEASHPAKIQSISTFSHFASPASTRQNVVLIAGMFRSDGTPDPAGVGVHRLYDQIGGYVLYATPGETDFTPPSLTSPEALKVGSNVGFAVDATDAEGTVEDVKVIYRDCSNTWRLATLQPSGGSSWSGGGPLASTCTTSNIDYYFQAVDDAGNVAVSSNKAQLEPVNVPDPTGETEIRFSLDGTLDDGGSGWYESNVVVTITPTPDSGLTYSVDNGESKDYETSFEVIGDGVHTVTAQAEDGSTNTVGFGIDTSAPTVLMKTPPEGAVYQVGQVVTADFTCADSGSGIASCTGTPQNGAQLETDTPGTKTITVTATDNVGRITEFSREYKVVYRPILFASSRTGNGDIYAIDPAGGVPSPLTTGDAIDAEPEWFPNGDRIAFTSSRTGNGDIYSMDAGGGSLDQLTSDPAIDLSPAVSPDGTQIAFASRRGGNWDIYVMNADGSNVRRLTNHRDDDLFPTWSSSTTNPEIAFFSKRSGNGDIYKLAVPPPSVTTIPANIRVASSSGVDTEPAWFGGTILFSSNRVANNNFEIFSVPSAGGTQSRLTFQAGHDVTPAWSVDGTKVAWASNRAPGGGLNFNIWTADANFNAGSQRALVTHGAADVFPDW